MRPQVLALHPGRGSSDTVAKAWVGPVQRWIARRRGQALQPPAVKGLRRRAPRDLGASIRLLRMVHYESHYPVHWPEYPRSFLTEGMVDAWVVVREGEILGHVALSPVGVGAASRLRWREMTGHEPGRSCRRVTVVRAPDRARAGHRDGAAGRRRERGS